MNALHITCLNCHRSWRLDIGDSVYLRLALESQPCPSCECCTLSCQEASEADPARPRRRNVERHPEALTFPGLLIWRPGGGPDGL
jgi:hypothetical protein